MKRQRTNRPDGPFWMTARYRGKCPCGFEIKPGQRIFWYPSDHRALCRKCGCKAELRVTTEDVNKILRAMRRSAATTKRRSQLGGKRPVAPARRLG